MKIYPILQLLILIVPITAFAAKLEDNIVIIDRVETYKLIPNKQNDQIETIKYEISNKFMATRAPSVAIDYIFYDDFTKIKKANVKAKGIKPLYKSATSEGIFYDDSKICAVPVPLEEVNKPIETNFEVSMTRPDIEPLRFIGGKYPIKQGLVKFIMPIEFKNDVNISLANCNDNISISQNMSDNKKEWVITIEYSDIPALESPKDAPPSRYIYPLYQMSGRFKTPTDLYRHLLTYTTDKDPNLEDVESKAIEITQNCTDDKCKIEAIYNWVHENIRYIAIEHGDLGSKPDLASEVLRKRFGDCKGSANLIKHMLLAIGLDGRLVWIGTRSIPDDYTDMPVYATGNHMIAAVKIDNDSIVYLDGTVGLADYGVYSNSIQGKQTIIENGDNCIIGRVPVQPATASSDVVEYQLQLTDNNTLQGTVKRTLAGNDKTWFLNRLNDAKPADKEKFINRQITGGRNTWNCPSAKIINNAPGNDPVSVEGLLNINRAIKTVGNKSYLIFDLASQIASLQFDTKDRIYPGWVKSPGLNEFNLTMQLNGNYQLSSLPEAVGIDNAWISGTISFSYNENDKIVTAKLTLIIKKEAPVPLESIDQFNNDVKKLAKASNITLVLSDTNK